MKERQEEETHEASKILEIVEKGIDISYSQPTHSLYEHLEDLYNQGKIERPFPIEDVDIRADFDILLETYCIRQPRERDFESISKMVYDYLEDNVGITIGDSDQDLFGEKLNEVKAKRKEYKERRIQHEEIIQADFLNQMSWTMLVCLNRSFLDTPFYCILFLFALRTFNKIMNDKQKDILKNYIKVGETIWI